MKKLVKNTFHTSNLVPWVVAEKGEDAVLAFQRDTQENKYRFSMGEEVAEKNNLELKMIVEKVIRETKKVGDVKGKRIVGIQCYWWREPCLDSQQTK